MHSHLCKVVMALMQWLHCFKMITSNVFKKRSRLALVACKKVELSVAVTSSRTVILQLAIKRQQLLRA